jgi:hypothetical protein
LLFVNPKIEWPVRVFPVPARLHNNPPMKTPLLLGVVLLLAGGLSSPAADSVELNGISCLGSQNLACFLLFQPAAVKPINFMLAEGESKYGFTLVAVEAAKRRVVVQQCGVKKYVRINSTPELIPTNDPEAETVAPGRHSIPLQASDKAAVAAYLAADDAARILAGNPRLPVAVVPGAVNGSNSGHGTSTGQNDAGPDVASPPGGSGTSSSSGNQGVNTGITGGNSTGTTGTGPDNSQNQLWIQESTSLEQSRLQTWDQVLSGQLEPLPRTPLTPPGTPSQLVGQDVFFANFIPGFKETGYLNQ